MITEKNFYNIVLIFFSFVYIGYSGLAVLISADKNIPILFLCLWLIATVWGIFPSKIFIGHIYGGFR